MVGSGQPRSAKAFSQDGSFSPDKISKQVGHTHTKKNFKKKFMCVRACACAYMDIPACFVCGLKLQKNDAWSNHSIVDLETNQHVHYNCLLKRTDELNEELEYHPCCDAMMHVAGWKISIDVFTETFAVYNPDNEMKYYFNGMKYCPFCGKGILIKKEGKVYDISLKQ